MRTLRKYIKPVHLVGLAMLAGLWGLRFVDPGPLQILRLKTFDFYQRLEPREYVPAPVTIIDLDDESLAAYGQWPWPRSLLAKLVSQLGAYGVAVVGFDIVFPEYDRMSPTLVADSLAGIPDDMADKLRALPRNEAAFAEAMKKVRVVLGQGTLPRPSEDREEKAVKASFAFKGVNPTDYLNRFPGVVRNVPELEENAAGLGMFSLTPEIDGVVRRVTTLLRVDEQIYPALTVEMLRVAAGQSTLLVKSDPTGVESIVIPKLTEIPLDRTGRVWVHFAPHDRARYVSAKDVLDGTLPKNRLAGHFAIIGTSAVGLLDIRATPISDVLPGVEVHAQLLEDILTQAFTQMKAGAKSLTYHPLTEPKFAKGVEMSIVIVVGLLMVLLVPLLGATYTLIFAVAVIAAMIGGSWYAYEDKRMLIDPIYPALSAMLLYMTLTYMNYVREEAQRRQVRGAFSRYMSPALVERLAEDPSQLKLGGEMKDMTLLFCDIRGFTTISEQFDPEGLTRFINRFLTPMTDVILQRQGTIDKYMGDCIMAFWNAPLNDGQHAAHGCESALVMLDACKDLNEVVKAEAEAEGRKHVPVKIGIGLNTGNVCVGNMGSDQRFDYSVLGDDVNLASRLEGQSKTYGVLIVIGEGTQREAPEFATIELDLIRVKGKTKPVRIFALLGNPEVANSTEFQTFKAVHEEMLAAYRAQRWLDARRKLTEARTLCAPWEIEGLYDLFEERIDAFEEASPGPDWDGVFVATSK
ncbi:MAG: adenylate/guanylate cyclase domain-containing protein [Rhodospirillaceae bacterium]|nr:adenylate/guanylate cyclase domain-containing protein [Rhodospirillaceae bacterium]